MSPRSSAALAACALLLAAAGPRGIGQPAPADLIAAWDTDVSPDGAGLPPGRGDVAQGQAVFSHACAACHAVAPRQVASGPALVGGQGTLASPKPVKTVGSYWPYATTLFDYVRRAMPFNAPGSLSDDQVYAVTAYVLDLNGIVADDAVMNAATLAAVRMPNREGFRSVWGATSR